MSADGIRKTFAIILNTAPEDRHFEMQEKMIQTLQDENADFDIYLVSDQRSSQKGIHQFPSKSKSYFDVIQELKKNNKMDEDDVVVFYSTSHGDKDSVPVKEKGTEEIALLPFSTISQELGSLPAKEQIVLMDQCFSGNGINSFTHPGHTRHIVTRGAKDEVTLGDNFIKYFIEKKGMIGDLDHDGLKGSLNDRFIYALQQEGNNTGSYPQIYEPGLAITLAGEVASRGAFSPQVITVHHKKDLERELGKLNPGQLALVDFSAKWCKPCREEYWPLFNRLAQEYQGQFLMIRAEGIDGSESDWNEYGVLDYPTAAFIKRVEGKNIITLLNKEEMKDPKSALLKVANIDKNFLVDRYLEQLQNKEIKIKSETTLVYDLQLLMATSKKTDPALYKRVKDIFITILRNPSEPREIRDIVSEALDEYDDETIRILVNQLASYAKDDSKEGKIAFDNTDYLLRHISYSRSLLGPRANYIRNFHLLREVTIRKWQYQQGILHIFYAKSASVYSTDGILQDALKLKDQRAVQQDAEEISRLVHQVRLSELEKKSFQSILERYWNDAVKFKALKLALAQVSRPVSYQQLVDLLNDRDHSRTEFVWHTLPLLSLTGDQADYEQLFQRVYQKRFRSNDEERTLLYIALASLRSGGFSRLAAIPGVFEFVYDRISKIIDHQSFLGDETYTSEEFVIAARDQMSITDRASAIKQLLDGSTPKEKEEAIWWLLEAPVAVRNSLVKELEKVGVSKSDLKKSIPKRFRSIFDAIFI